jgi:hypothetical protein
MTNHELYNRYNLKPWLGILPGDDWLKENEHNLDGWTPGIEMSAPGIKYTINLKKEQPGIVRDILRK